MTEESPAVQASTQSEGDVRSRLGVPTHVARIIVGAGAVVFAIILPLLFVSTNVRWVVNSHWLYAWDFHHYPISDHTELSLSQLYSAADQIVHYFNDNTQFLDVRVHLNGTLVSLYDQREILHMRDVKTLIQGVYKVQMWTLVYAGLFLILGFALRGRGFLKTLARAAKWSAIGSIAIVAILGIWMAINFNSLFILFHEISFSNNLWELDPYTSYLLAMFPEGFFLDTALIIAFLAVLEFLSFGGLTWWLSRRLTSAHQAEESVAAGED